ncbi:MAG: methionine--tRNA ligase [Clostridia bacterium]|nr:methionine--tRNA ligase [Clostridia bacterium]
MKEIIMSKPTYYITTPIYYPSGKWHLGTCYTTVVCDALARFKRMQGFDTYYLTGTDEHGQKIEGVAQKAGVTPKEFVDKQVDTLIKLWELLGISYDQFIRTTDREHEEAVQKIFTKLYEKGDIYKAEYEGWYCVPCESFWTKTQLIEGKCPDCGREVILTKEESYFFRLSKYQDRLIRLIEDNPEFLLPKSRQNEMLNNFLRPGLQDLAVTRTSFKWGVPVPFDDKHVIYVWIDALANYITALGYTANDPSLFNRYWPADVHMMGKEIVRFHSIIWPALLMALDLPVPKKVYGHGWLLLGSDKISKSRGNIVDPVELSARYSVDAIRYFLLREVPFGNDGIYTNLSLLSRINSDLVNDLGNLIKRTVAMVVQYCGGIIPEFGVVEENDKDIINNAETMLADIIKNMDSLLVPEALQRIWSLIQRANKYIDENAPWLLFKDSEKAKRLDTVLYILAECIRFVGVALTPYIPTTAADILKELGLACPDNFDGLKAFGQLKAGGKVYPDKPLFPRIDIPKELESMERRAAELAGDNSKPEEAPSKLEKAQIAIEDFAKINLQVGTVKSAEKMPKADKLLILKVDIAGKERTIVSGIAKWYTPTSMIGKQVVVIANLAPAKLRGVDSEGMILCAENKNGDIVVVSPESLVESGSEVR